MGGHRVWEFTVEGRNLKRLAGLLKEGRLDWIREADRDFGYEDGQLYIGKITPRRVKRQELEEG